MVTASVTVVEKPSELGIQYEYAIAGTIHNPSEVEAYVAYMLFETSDRQTKNEFFEGYSDPILRIQPLLAPGATWQWDNVISLLGWGEPRPEVPTLRGALLNGFWTDPRYIGFCSIDAPGI